MNLIQIVRDHWIHILVPMGFVVGCYLDRKNYEKLTAFRNRSVLFKRELRPNEEVTRINYSNHVYLPSCISTSHPSLRLLEFLSVAYGFLDSQLCTV
ncbi:NADH dehydrogenase [ubiquinone] 1 beta subcomplex subunit 1-like [Manis pentadactyla]|uniref:NADH dehydrogenase [ubiquinone] 1 beta subcomplex subunit 1-like n=1 Tax=Manis pentadactyla TaxID=143292 RepID=UPI001874AA4E|nr:NADH dehydrogenase [ubiquinone] 1 beta subcomplex subunit 1-like [Manis pentadactyla]